MTSTETTWPTPLLLPGQAAAPPGPCDLTGMYLIHHAFRRDLDRFAHTVARVPATDADTWAALLTRWDRFAGLLQEHHTKEDEVLWPLMSERAEAAGDVAGLRVLEEMEAEHALIDPLLAQARAGLVAREESSRAALHATLLRTGEVLGAHLGHEERAAIALMQRYIPGAEWTELENTKLRGKFDPGVLLFMLPWLAEGLTPAVLAPVVDQAGLPFRLLLRLGRRRYDRLERAAFGDLAGCLTDHLDV